MQKNSELVFLTGERSNESIPPQFLNRANTETVRRIHFSMPSYQPTPLISLKNLAKKLGVRAIYVKDESHRFGLNAFKGLGGIYAISRIVCEELGLDIDEIKFEELLTPENKKKISKLVFVTATDGNHGKGIAWAASLLGCSSYVFMPKGSSEIRKEAIRNAGKAEVIITDLNYDDTVRYALEMSQQNGWVLVQDTSWSGYEKIPAWIMQGYTTMVHEAMVQLKECGVHASPTHLFLQAGVGAMAGGVIGATVDYCKDHIPVITIVEPSQAACIFESIKKGDGKPHPATENGNTIMAGLNCGEPCTIAWPIIRDFASHFVSCSDDVAKYGMQLLAHPQGEDSIIVSGESGAAPLGVLALLAEKFDQDKQTRYCGLDQNSVILLFNTEGDTDPESYKAIIQSEHNEISSTQRKKEF